MTKIMSLLSIFPPLPPRGNITTAEHHGKLVYTKAEQHCTTVPEGCPHVSLSCDSARSSVSQESARSAFLVQHHTTWKRLLRAWYEQGVTGALDELIDTESDPDADSNMHYIRKLLNLVNCISQLQSYIFPQSKLSAEELITQCSSGNLWLSGSVRALAWHPHTNRLAMAYKDDSIKLYSAAHDLVPLLKYKLQKHVADLQWQPFNSSVLAVGCGYGVLIWNIEPMSLATRPASSAVKALQVTGHTPVKSISWNPTGTLLLSASPNDMAMIVWDVSIETYVPLRRVGAGGVTQVAWSPDGRRVFSSTTSKVFRVWETKSWSCEKWSNLSSSCQTACWSPDSSVLLFCIANEPIIYYVTFSSVVGGSSTAVKCADLSEVMVQTEDGEMRKVGGTVRSMVWDSTGERLAVTFRESAEGNCNVVALFRTKISPLIEFSPCGFVVGHEGDVPELVSFLSHYQHGVLLSVVWSNSGVAYIPLNFLPSQAIGGDLHKSSLTAHLFNTTDLHSTHLHTSLLE